MSMFVDGVCVMSNFWEGIALLVGLGIWIGAAGMYQYLKRRGRLTDGVQK